MDKHGPYFNMMERKGNYIFFFCTVGKTHTHTCPRFLNAKLLELEQEQNKVNKGTGGKVRQQ